MLNLKRGPKRLTPEQVMQIRDYYSQGYTQGSIANYFGISVTHVGRIVRGETWRAGAALREPSPAEMDSSMRRMQALQESIDKRGEVVDPWVAAGRPPAPLPISPEAAARAASYGARVIPLSPLDGGDGGAAEEEEAGLAALQHTAGRLA